jgi:hypothetical protein
MQATYVLLNKKNATSRPTMARNIQPWSMTPST